MDSIWRNILQRTNLAWNPRQRQNTQTIPISQSYFRTTRDPITKRRCGSRLAFWIVYSAFTMQAASHLCRNCWRKIEKSIPVPNVIQNLFKLKFYFFFSRNSKIWNFALGCSCGGEDSPKKILRTLNHPIGKTRSTFQVHFVCIFKKTKSMICFVKFRKNEQNWKVFPGFYSLSKYF